MNLLDSIAQRNANLKRGPRRRLLYKLGDKLAGADGPAAAVLQSDPKTMVASAVISTPQKDRGGDIMRPLGCRLENYAKNPVVLYAHGELPYPVGVAEIDGKLQVFPEENRVWAKCRFAQKGPGARYAAEVFGLIDEGIIRGTSIGFQPITGTKIQPTRGAPDSMDVFGFDISEWDLLEFSWVAVPMQPQAVTLGFQADRIATVLSRGIINGVKISAPMRKSLAVYAAKGRLVIPVTLPKANPDSPGMLQRHFTPEKIAAIQAKMPPRAQWSKDTQSCVSRKIPKLISEGYDQEQAAAIAYSMCGEKGDHMPGTDIQMVKIPKANAATEEEAKAMCEKYGYKTDKPAHDETHWGYEQFPKEQLVGESTEGELKDGLVGVMGTRKQDAAYESTPNGTDMPGMEEPPDEEPPLEGKPSDKFFAQVAEMIGHLQELLESAESTQDHQGIIDAAPMWLEGLQAIMGEIEEMQSENGTKKKKEDKPDKETEEKKEDEPGEDDDKKKRFRATWAAGKAADAVQEQLMMELGTLKTLYNAPNLTKAQKTHITVRYNAVKKLLAGTPKPAEPAVPALDSDAIAKALAARDEKLKAFDDRFASLTGALP